MCHSVPVEVRGHFCVVSSLFTLCESQSLKSGHQACVENTFSELCFSFLFLKVYPPIHPLLALE